jgi:hypothetical protein
MSLIDLIYKCKCGTRKILQCEEEEEFTDDLKFTQCDFCNRRIALSYAMPHIYSAGEM